MRKVLSNLLRCEWSRPRWPLNIKKIKNRFQFLKKLKNFNNSTFFYYFFIPSKVQPHRWQEDRLDLEPTTMLECSTKLFVSVEQDSIYLKYKFYKIYGQLAKTRIILISTINLCKCNGNFALSYFDVGLLTLFLPDLVT